jgi:hypothetical protein
LERFFTRVGETKLTNIEDQTEEEKLSFGPLFELMDQLTDSQLDLYARRRGLYMIQCPNCGNDNPNLITTYGHRREQMDCQCEVCAKGWVEIFKAIPKEEILPYVPRITPTVPR